ncbi:MAG: ABC transporter permease [Anaerolineaceae bacterium]
MKKFWLIFAQEYKRHVLRKRFIFAILSMPLFVGFLVLIGFLTVRLQYNGAPVGYIDSYHIFSNPQPAPVADHNLLPSANFVAYTSEASARTDLDANKIQAYFVLSENYLANGQVTLVKTKESGSNIEGDFGSFLKNNLLAGKPEAVITRLTEGNDLIIRSADGSRELAANNWMAIAMPFIAGILFIIAVNVSGGYLLQAVVEEKDNRTMEIIITSVSPTQLMAGKILADLLIGLTELVIWLLFTLIALRFVPQWIAVGQSTKIDAGSILLMAGTFIPAFVMVAAAMGAIGATAAEPREAQQIAGLFTLPIVVPFWFVTAIMFNPNGAISVGLSMFPLTAPIALPLRGVFTNIPTWQIVTTISVLCILAAFMVWLAGRVFHIGMLRYGKKVTFREVFRKQPVQGI